MSFVPFSGSGPSGILPWNYSTEGLVPSYQHGLAEGLQLDLGFLQIGDPSWLLIEAARNTYGPNAGFDWAFLAHEGRETEVDSRMLFLTLPESLTESKLSLFNNIPIVGRSEPYKVYAGGGPRTINFRLDFLASIEPRDGLNTTNMVKRIRWLQSNLYPRRTGTFGMVTHPPVLTFRYGRLFPKLIRVVMTRCTVEWKQPWMIDTFERNLFSDAKRRALQTEASNAALDDPRVRALEQDPADIPERNRVLKEVEAENLAELNAAREEAYTEVTHPMSATATIELEEVTAPFPHSNETFLEDHLSTGFGMFSNEPWYDDAGRQNWRSVDEVSFVSTGNAFP